MSMKMGDISGMREDALKSKLAELEMEMVAGQHQSTKLKSIRLSIARIKTHLASMKRGAAQKKGPKPAPKSAPQAKPAESRKAQQQKPKSAKPEAGESLNTSKQE